MGKINLGDVPHQRDRQPKFRIARSERRKAKKIGIGINVSGVMGSKNINLVAEPPQLINQDLGRIRYSRKIRFIRISEKSNLHFSTLLASLLKAAWKRISAE